MLKKKAYMGQPKTQLILAAPVIINDTCQLPDFIVNLSPIVTMLKHLKKCNYVDKPVGPNVNIELGGSIFSMRHLLAYGHRPSGSRLSTSPCIVLSRFLSFVQHVHNGRQRRRGEHTKAQEGIRPPKEVPY